MSAAARPLGWPGAQYEGAGVGLPIAAKWEVNGKPSRGG